MPWFDKLTTRVAHLRRDNLNRKPLVFVRLSGRLVQHLDAAGSR